MSKRLVVRIDNRIRIDRDELPEACASDLKDRFEHANPEVAKARAIGVRARIPPIITTWESRGGEFTLPRGGMGRLREVLREHGVAYEVRDERCEGSPSPGFPEYVGPDLRWYQEAGITRIVEKEQGIIRAGTGSGKTTMAFAAIARVGLNAIVILPNIGLFEQWQERAAKELGLRGDRLGMLGQGHRRLRPVTIAMQNTLWRLGVHDQVHDYFGHVLFDEAQLAAARTVNETLDRFPARFRVAVSADETRKDGKEFLTYDQFGDVIHEVDQAVIEEQGYVVDVAIMVMPTEFRAPWYGVGPGRKIDFNRLLREMAEDPARDALALRIAHDEIRSGEQCILLTGHRDHTRQLDRYFVSHGIESGYLLGEKEKGDREEFQRTKRGLMDGSVRVGIGTYKALGVGIDMPAIAAGVAVTPISSNPQQTNQVRGRLCRPSKDKPNGRLHVLWDRHVYPRHLDVLIQNNKTVLVWDGSAYADARAWRRRNRAR